MQGVVRDEKDRYVKAAIVKLFKVNDSSDDSDAEAITYTKTDDNGRFIIQDLNPEEKYIIEIHIEDPVSEPLKNDFNDENHGIKSNNEDSHGIKSNYEIKNKPYLSHNNTWW